MAFLDLHELHEIGWSRCSAVRPRRLDETGSQSRLVFFPSSLGRGNIITTSSLEEPIIGLIGIHLVNNSVQQYPAPGNPPVAWHWTLQAGHPPPLPPPLPPATVACARRLYPSKNSAGPRNSLLFERGLGHLLRIERSTTIDIKLSQVISKTRATEVPEFGANPRANIG